MIGQGMKFMIFLILVRSFRIKLFNFIVYVSFSYYIFYF